MNRFRISLSANNFYYAQQWHGSTLVWESQRCLTLRGAERLLRKRRRMVNP